MGDGSGAASRPPTTRSAGGDANSNPLRLNLPASQLPVRASVKCRRKGDNHHHPWEMGSSVEHYGACLTSVLAAGAARDERQPATHQRKWAPERSLQ